MPKTTKRGVFSETSSISPATNSRKAKKKHGKSIIEEYKENRE
jgi:hypothetical protein